MYRADIDTTCIRIDLEYALQSNALTPRQRQAVALYYFCELTQEECAVLLGVTHANVGRRLKNAVANIAAHMQGDNVYKSQYVDPHRDEIVGRSGNLLMWNHCVLVNAPRWWVSDSVYADLNRIFGIPIVEKVENDTEPNVYTTKQMERKFGREIPRAYIYPKFDNTGRKVDENDVDCTI